MTGTLLLPDISEFQPDADLGGIKAMNGGAVILRVAYGTSHPDAAFARHRAAASSLGYSFCGLYQYLVAGQDAVAQAREFIRLVGRLGPHEVAILDLEEGDGDQAARAAQWATLVDGTLGGTSWLYSGLSFAQEHGLGPVFAGPRHTWVAAYGDTEPSLGHTLWQSTDGRQGSHITDWPGAGRCDTSVYRGTLAQLAATTARQPPQAAPKPAPKQEDDMPSGVITATAGTRQSFTWPAGVKQIVLFSDWHGLQDSPPVVDLRVAHLNSPVFEAGHRTVDGTSVYELGSPNDCNGASFTRIDGGAATVAFHCNP